MGQNGREDDVDIRRKRTSSLPCDESVVQRSAQKQKRWKIVDPLLCRFGNDKNCFSHTFFCNQLSLYGAVAEMCEEYEFFHDRTGKPVDGGQSSSSFVLSVIKTDVPLESDDRAHKDLQLQKYGERIEKVSQQDKLSKFCMGSEFLNVVEIGQYFMTKDTAEFSQFTDAVACREYTLPRDEETSEAKGLDQREHRIGPVLEVTTCCLQSKYGVEIRIMSLNKDYTYSWVRISHGSNRFVMNLNNEQETSEMQFEDYALRLNAGDFACRSKGQSKTTKTRFCQILHKNYTYWKKNLDLC